MKDLSDITVCVVDYGKFILLAEAFAGKAAKTYYYSPTEREFEDINDAVKGDGLPEIHRIDNFFNPAAIDEIDLFVFPDIGCGGTQKYLRSIGKAVWGAMGANVLELSRTKFLSFLDDCGLPKVHNEIITGLEDLREHLKNVNDKWIKVNRYRACMETYHHIDYAHSAAKLDELAVRFGGLQNGVTFVVQDAIKSDVEIGYDGWTVDGKFPSSSFQGYELKNELYLGSLLEYSKLPKQVRYINEAMSPMLKEHGYRNFIATEIRIKDDVPYFIDPTLRMAGLTQDQIPETCSNIADVIWQGANGILIEPEYISKFVAVATMHYEGHVPHHWFSISIPKDYRRWFKLYHFCFYEGAYHFAPSVPYETDEAGTVIGIGDTIEDAIFDLKDHFALLESEPLHIHSEGFYDLIKQVQSAEKQGVEFTDQTVPEPGIAMEEQ